MTLLSISDCARLLRVTRSRIYQLAREGRLEKSGPLVSLDSVCEQIFRVQGDTVTYLPLKWKLKIHRPAVKWWPVCGAKIHDGSASVSAEAVPSELQDEPEFAAKIARLALDWIENRLL